MNNGIKEIEMKLKIVETRTYTYPNQCQPQSRFFELNGENPEVVKVKINHEIGNSVPAKIFNNFVFRVDIPDGYTRDQIKEFWKTNKKFFKKVLLEWKEVYNGNNYVGQLNEEGRARLEELHYLIYST